MVIQLLLYAIRRNITLFTKLKTVKYRELRSIYPNISSHYVYIECQDTSMRVKSFLKLKKNGLTNREYSEVRCVST
ncbi:MAG: hypothetical protein QXS22_06495 [Acidilobaceae archaeon]